MKPGKELDILITEKVFGHEVVRTEYNKGKNVVYSLGKPDYYDSAGESILSNPVPNYSEDIAKAWEVVDFLRNKNRVLALSTLLDTSNNENKLLWIAQWEMHDPDYCFVFEIAESAPHAICMASLKAIE